MDINNPATEMTRRSAGVGAIGWLMIILGVVSLQRSFDVAAALEIGTTLYGDAPGRIFYFVTIPLLIAEVILGINILRLKEWARKGVIILIAAYLVLTLSMSLTVNKNYAQYIQQSYSELQQAARKIKLRYQKRKAEYERRLAVSSTAAERAAVKKNFWIVNLPDFYTWLGITVLVTRFFLWYLVAPVFFTRPKVKAQFS